METGSGEQQTKQERMRTRWTASLDQIFANLVVEQIRLGNRTNHVFDKKTWGHIRDEFNRQTMLNFNNNQLRKHLDVLRTRYNNLKSAMDQNGFVTDDPCYIGFDLWDGMGVQQPKPETVKVKECPIYDQLCIIFEDNGNIGKYAQSSHYEDVESKGHGNGAPMLPPTTSHPELGTPVLEKAAIPVVEAPSSSRPVEELAASAEKNGKNLAEDKKKKQRPSATKASSMQNEKDLGLVDTMAQALEDMIAASRSKVVPGSSSNGTLFTIANCIRGLDEIQGIDDLLYFDAVDHFENPMFRETFMTINSSEQRLQWLRSKCGHVGAF